MASVDDHAHALRQLLPTGVALAFQDGSTGKQLLQGLAAEQERVEQAAEAAVTQAIALHTVGLPTDYKLATLQSWLDEHYPGVVASYGETKPLRVGFRAGARAYSQTAVHIVLLTAPAEYCYDNAMRAGFRAGDRVTSTAIKSTIDREQVRRLLMSHVDCMILKSPL